MAIRRTVSFPEAILMKQQGNDEGQVPAGKGEAFLQTEQSRRNDDRLQQPIHARYRLAN